MGVDLRLEHLQLSPALLALLADDVVHQVPHGRHHGAHRPTQMLDLVAAPLLNLHILLSALQGLDGLLQAADGVGDAGGDAKVQKGHEKDGEEKQ